MKSNQKLGRIVGILLVLVIAVGVPSLSLRGLSGLDTSDPNYLQLLYENALNTRYAVVLDILSSTIWLAIVLLLFKRIKEYDIKLALAILSIWLINFGIVIYGDISTLSLLELAQHYALETGFPTDVLMTLGDLKIEDYYGSHFLALISYATATFLFYYFLLKSKYIPAWLAIWGMLAMTLVFSASWANIFKLDVSFYFYSQNGIHLILFMGWLLFKGFATPKTIKDHTNN